LNNDDKAMVLEYVERNEIETSFLYANVLTVGLENNREIRRCGDYFGYFEGLELKGILPFYNLGSCIPHYESPDAVPLFLQIIKDRKFEYLLGMDHIVRPIYRMLDGVKNIRKCNESSYFINDAFTPFHADGLSFVNSY